MTVHVQVVHRRPNTKAVTCFLLNATIRDRKVLLCLQLPALALFWVLTVAPVYLHLPSNHEDSADSAPIKPSRSHSSMTRSCPIPWIPPERLMTSESNQWIGHHHLMEKDISYFHDDLDFVLFGDSIVERFNGTRGIGRGVTKEEGQVFHDFFRSPSSSFKGMALGTAGDTSSQLLLHLHNFNVLPNPRVFIVLIGTNDVGRAKCSAESIYDAIMTVLRALHSMRAAIPIIVHALLPRATRSNFTLGRHWRSIQLINRRLESSCSKRPELHYLDVNDLFISEENTIRQDLMPDALHPSAAGYRVWAPRIVKALSLVLNRTVG